MYSQTLPKIYNFILFSAVIISLHRNMAYLRNIIAVVPTTFLLLFLSVCKASQNDQNSPLIIVQTNVDKEPSIQLQKLNATNAAMTSNDTLPTQSAISEMTTKTPRVLCFDDKKFDAFHGGILNYFLRMETCDIIEDTDTRMKRICSRKQFAYNEYYNVTYLVACHQQRFQEICGKHKLVIPWRRDYAVNSSLFIENFRAQNDMELVAKSCSSIMEFLQALEREMTPMNNATVLSSHYTSLIKDHVLTTGKLFEVEYSEWYIATFPFCRNFACGASKYNHLTTKTSVHDCMPRECRGTIIFSIIFDAILAVLIIIANSLVLGVAARTRIMRNIPGYFKISLALADLTVGLFVLPCCIYVTSVVFLGAMPYRGPGHKQSLADYMPTSVGHFISFFVVFSFAVSIYTMAVASIDRYLAITKPFEYRQGHYLTKRRSAWAFSMIWFIGFFIAAFPAMSRSRMGISAFNIVLSVGFTSTIVYAVTLFIPLLAVWALNGAMLKQVCADREKRSTIRASSSVMSSQYSTKITSINNNHSKDMSVIAKAGDTHQSPVTSNGSSVGYQRHEKPTALPSKEGVIEKLKRKRSRMLSSSTSRKQSLPRSINVERRLARTLAIMIGAFTIALLPCIATMIAFAILSGNPTPTTVNQLSSALYLASRIFLSNSFWNCIIYSIRNEHFRRAMWAIFLCKKKRIARRLRESLSMTHLKHKGQNSSGASMNEKQSLSKSNSNSSNSTIYKNDNRRSTQMWSFTSQQSISPSRKGSDEPDVKTNAIRTMSCSTANHTNGILKKTIGRSESAPDGTHGYQNTLAVPNVS